MADAPPALHTLALPVTASAAAVPVLQGDALLGIVTERIAQVDHHGFTLAHDASYTELELPAAACAYLVAARDLLVWQDDNLARQRGSAVWPWDHARFLPEPTPRENLIKAAALIWAAVDRLDGDRATLAQAAAANG